MNSKGPLLLCNRYRRGMQEWRHGKGTREETRYRDKGRGRVGAMNDVYALGRWGYIYVSTMWLCWLWWGQQIDWALLAMVESSDRLSFVGVAGLGRWQGHRCQDCGHALLHFCCRKGGLLSFVLEKKSWSLLSLHLISGNHIHPALIGSLWPS